MNLRIVLRPAVDDDLHSITAYFDSRDLKIADRFVAAALDALVGLAQMPGKGSPKAFRRDKLPPIRSWLVPGFDKYVIFYVVDGDSLVVLAILHGARDVRKILRKR
ncbi:MAG TPA: type II toxin-antitoxin system RelE/ParE family toxin [Tepidisphaeraceae bacterium]|jgi:plasmid stabilization system protein ParE